MEQEQKLGIKVFYYYLYKKILLGIILLIISMIVLSLKSVLISKLALLFPASITSSIISFLTTGLFVFSFLALIGGAFLSWLNYISCTFILSDISFIIKRGILSKKTVSMPYRQIQDISIEQSFSDRLMGVCKLAILTAGNDNNDKEGEAEGIFNTIDINVAKNLQNIILQKNNLPKS